MRSHPNITVFCVLFFVLTSRIQTASAYAQEPGIKPEKKAAQPDKADVAVIVNGFEITEADIEQQIAPQLDRIAEKVPPGVLQRYRQQFRQQFLEKMIVEKLLDRQVQDANIVVSEQQAVQKIKEMAAQQNPPLSLEEFKNLLDSYGQSFEDTKQRIRKGLAYQKLMEAQWTGKIDVNVADANQYYNSHLIEFKTPEQVRASHILIKPETTEPGADPNQANARAKAKAYKLLEKIRNGADFATLARENSACPSGAQGGDLGFFEGGRMVPPFEQAAFKLEVGQVSDIVETTYGYHIIRLTDRKKAGTTTFEQARDDIIKMLIQKKRGEFAESYIESLKAKATIVYPPGKEPPSSLGLR